MSDLQKAAPIRFTLSFVKNDEDNQWADGLMGLWAYVEEK